MAKSRVARRRGRLIVAVLLAVFVIVSASVIWRRSVGIAQARTLRDLETTLKQLEGERARLTSALQEETSRRRLGAIAERKLGMHVPSDRQVVFLRRVSADAR